MNIAIKFEVIDGRIVLYDRNWKIVSPNNTIFWGNFDLYNTKVKTLEGSPEIIYGDYNCSGLKLTSLKGASKIVTGDFICHSNKLTSLDGCSKIINGDLCCSDNVLTTFRGAPYLIGGEFDCSWNPHGLRINEYPHQNQDIFKPLLNEGLFYNKGNKTPIRKFISISYDGIFTIYKTKDFHYDEIIYYATEDGKKFARGYTEKGALITLISDPCGEKIVSSIFTKLEICKNALELIACGKRPDGTYNRCREACEQLAKETLEKIKE